LFAKVGVGPLAEVAHPHDVDVASALRPSPLCRTSLY
jgi:hypothetical protein